MCWSAKLGFLTELRFRGTKGLLEDERADARLDEEASEGPGEGCGTKPGGAAQSGTAVRACCLAAFFRALSSARAVASAACGRIIFRGDKFDEKDTEETEGVGIPCVLDAPPRGRGC